MVGLRNERRLAHRSSFIRINPQTEKQSKSETGLNESIHLSASACLSARKDRGNLFVLLFDHCHWNLITNPLAGETHRRAISRDNLISDSNPIVPTSDERLWRRWNWDSVEIELVTRNSRALISTFIDTHPAGVNRLHPFDFLSILLLTSETFLFYL